MNAAKYKGSGTSAADHHRAGGAALRRNLLWLLALTLGAALLLTLLFWATQGRIAQQQRQTEREALLAVLPPAEHDNDLLAAAFSIDPANGALMNVELLGLSAARSAYLATWQGQPSGVILPLETAGYNGPMLLLVGVTSAGVITGVRVLHHSETPGLGDSIELQVSRWILGFDNRSLANTPDVLWQVKQEGGEFDQFVGATLTPRAVVTAVHQALQFFALNRAALLAASGAAQ